MENLTLKDLDTFLQRFKDGSEFDPWLFSLSEEEVRALVTLFTPKYGISSLVLDKNFLEESLKRPAVSSPRSHTGRTQEQTEKTFAEFLDKDINELRAIVEATPEEALLMHWCNVVLIPAINKELQNT